MFPVNGEWRVDMEAAIRQGPLAMLGVNGLGAVGTGPLGQPSRKQAGKLVKKQAGKLVARGLSLTVPPAFRIISSGNELRNYFRRRNA